MRLNNSALEALRTRVLADVEAGLPFGGVEGCTAAIGYRGEIVWEEGFGAASADTPIVLMSVTKTVIEAALWVLFARKGLSPDTRVVEVVPEFMGGSEPGITIGMVETHLGGFAWNALDDSDAATREGRLAAFRSWRPEGQPGFYEYHPLNGAWVLAEIIERASGRDYRQFLRDEVLQPLALARPDGLRLGGEEGELRGVLLHRNLMNGYTPDPKHRLPVVGCLDTLPGLTLGIPGIGAVGTASSVALLYQAYLHNPGELWRPDVLAEARDQIRVEMPDNFGRPMLRSLSFVHAGRADDRYGERTFFGPLTSPRAFGHQGQGGQIAWADPQSGVSFAYLTNTIVFPPGGMFHARSRELSALAASVIE
jgi:CubicO group peptidase (beta-lactamase class C family)